MEKSPSTKYSQCYKALASSKDLQEKRRQQLLKEQKERRQQCQDDTREIEEFVEKLQKPHYRSYAEKYQADYSLQLSEWLREKPSNLTEWYLVPCPKGQRCLVIACKGRTEMYNRKKKLVRSFPSLLPGDGTSRQHTTILDCIWVEKMETFFILDVLAYRNQILMDCDTMFRFYWIKSRFSEEPVTDVSDRNRYSFIPITFYNFINEEEIRSCLQRYPLWDNNIPELDGFLFYHKEASYVCGTTPLVGWLFAFMIPEVLNLEVNEKYMEEKPKDYVDYLHYMTVFDEEQAKKHRRWSRKGRGRQKMDVEEGDDDDCSPDDTFEEEELHCDDESEQE